MRSERLGRYVFFGLAGVYVAFIAYVSWTPVPPEDYVPNRSFFYGIQRLPYLFFPHHFRDFATNILLYIPLGALVASATAAGRPRFFGRWLAAGFLVTVIMEVGQSFFDRYPDALDIITNTIGYTVGYCAVVAAVRWYGFNPIALTGFDAESGRDRRTRTVAVARFVYACAYLLAGLVPFDISVVYHEVYAQLFPNASGRIQLVIDPRYHLYLWPSTAWHLLAELLALMPLAILSAWLGRLKGRVDVASAVFPCVMVSLLCEFMQVFILSRTSDVAMFPLAAAAGVLGWTVVKTWFRKSGPVRPPAPPKIGESWRFHAVAVAACALAIAVVSLAPFKFERDHQGVAVKLFGELNLVPFRYTTSAADVVLTAALFVPLGFLVFNLLRAISPWWTGKKTIIWSGAACAVAATAVEFTQNISAGRFFDATDVVLALVGGAGGALLAAALGRRRADHA